MKSRRCSRCREQFPARDLTRWLNDCGTLSPEYCDDCYEWILSNYEDGMDIESMLDDDIT